MSNVTLDLANGRASVAGVELAVRVGDGGVLTIGDDGPLLRSISFGDRSRAVRAARTRPVPGCD